MRNQTLIGLVLFGAALWLAWEAGQKIIAGDLRTLEFAALAVAACGAAVTILRNWRLGFYLFFVWMLVEDLVRKYLGNGTLLFFGKDVLLGLVYVAMYAQIRRGKEKWFRAPFLLFLSMFFWLAVLEVFNEYSPSILYGLLGLKLYFYYLPLIYVGYALIRSDEDLRKFLRLNVIAAIVISGLGIVQAIRGNSFLNPAQLAPALQDLGNLQKVSPISGEVFTLPDSVFVSSGRFDVYLIVAFVVAIGWVGYALLYRRTRPTFGFIAIGTIGAATLLCGSRSALIGVLVSALALSAGFLWGAPWRWGHGRRLFKAIRTSVIVCALALAAAVLIFPQKAGSRIAFYTETLTPSSSAYQLSTRTWDYPVQQFLDAFQGHWLVGNGTGTASLGTQYVSGLLGEAPPGVWVEEGFGALIAEMGILAPLLWLLWGGALVYYSWKIVRRLRGTRFFPLALAIVWYAFLLIFPMTYGALSAYQDFICNIYLWLMIGILFRLPEIASSPLSVPEVSRGRARRWTWWRPQQRVHGVVRS
ncbi:MAG: hypothetical protein ACRD5K_11125 [Candidatus Acidiferrales bacterium]